MSSPESAGSLRGRALEKISVGEIEEACRLFQEAAEAEPDAGEGWVNLAMAERALGRLDEAHAHFALGVERLEAEADADPERRGFLASALHAQAAALEEGELTERAAEIYRRAARVDPRSPTPLQALALLLARAGRLDEAERVISDWCKAAVSVLAEKRNLAPMRAFQKALREASALNPSQLIVATREAYARGFAETVAKLPEGVQLEAEPFRADAEGRAAPVIPDPARPFARVRLDAVDPSTGERWMIQETPTYGFPADFPGAAEGCFSVRLPVSAPFPVFLSTRTAWDYFFIRIRFAGGRGQETIGRCERHLGRWFERGFSGEWREGGRGFFHFLSPPTLLGEDAARYEVDLGLSGYDALGGLFEALCALHDEEPLALVMLGEAALP